MGETTEARLACAIAEQQVYLAELCQIWNRQLSQQEGGGEENLRLLSLMAPSGSLELPRRQPHCVNRLSADGCRTYRAAASGEIRPWYDSAV